jgi:hypothetical protein
LSNRNHFPVDYYFRPYQTPKNTEIILRRNKRSIREYQMVALSTTIRTKGRIFCHLLPLQKEKKKKRKTISGVK